ncbi:hypothetical protein NL676_032618 [Syzygium grande]|nr:hypothetical protein NL676_032618 [Syzygium grande]
MRKQRVTSFSTTSSLGRTSSSPLKRATDGPRKSAAEIAAIPLPHRVSLTLRLLRSSTAVAVRNNFARFLHDLWGRGRSQIIEGPQGFFGALDMDMDMISSCAFTDSAPAVYMKHDLEPKLDGPSTFVKARTGRHPPTYMVTYLARVMSIAGRRSQPDLVSERVNKIRRSHMAKSPPPSLLWLANRATKSRAMATFLSLPPRFLLRLTASLASWVAKGSTLAMPPAKSGARGFGGGDSQA